MHEYDLKYVVKFKVGRKSLETLNEVKSLGSSISSLEFCMMLDDKLKQLGLTYEDIDKISYYYNRDNDIIIKQQLVSKKRIYKSRLDEIRSDTLNKTNEYFKKNVFHVFHNKEYKRLEMFIRII